MAMSRGAKIGLGVGVVALALLALGGAAIADDVVDDDDDDDDDDVDDDDDDDIPDEPPPPPADPKKNNYVGAPGYSWPHKDRFPNERSFGLFLQQLGYNTNPGLADWSPISAATMVVVRQFQRDYNVARLAQTVDEPAPKSLSTDGLIGKNTIGAMLNAERWIIALAIPWQDLVALS